MAHLNYFYYKILEVVFLIKSLIQNFKPQINITLKNSMKFEKFKNYFKIYFRF